MKRVSPKEIFEALAKKQDCSPETLENPKEGDFTSMLLNDIVNESKTIEDLSDNLSYAASMITKSIASLRKTTWENEQKIGEPLEPIEPEGLLEKVIKEDTMSNEDIEEELFEICDSVHAHCNEECPVYRINKGPLNNHKPFEENRGCDAFKSGKTMHKFVKAALDGEEYED